MILCYHAFDADWPSPLAVTPQAFAAHCQWLARARRVLPLAEAVGRITGSGRLPRGTVSLTIDDGFGSVHRHAFPILAQHGFPSTVFVVARTLAPGGLAVDWVDNPPEEPLSTLDLEQVLEMRDSGVEIGSHSSEHHDLTTLSDEECERDLRESRELLEDLLKQAVPHLAYPRGRCNERVRRAAERAGFVNAFTLPEVREPFGPFAIPRVGVYRGSGVRDVAIKSSPWYLPLRTNPLMRKAIGKRPSRGGPPG